MARLSACLPHDSEDAATGQGRGALAQSGSAIVFGNYRSQVRILLPRTSHHLIFARTGFGPARTIGISDWFARTKRYGRTYFHPGQNRDPVGDGAQQIMDSRIRCRERARSRASHGMDELRRHEKPRSACASAASRKPSPMPNAMALPIASKSRRTRCEKFNPISDNFKSSRLGQWTH